MINNSTRNHQVNIVRQMDRDIARDNKIDIHRTAVTTAATIGILGVMFGVIALAVYTTPDMADVVADQIAEQTISEFEHTRYEFGAGAIFFGTAPEDDALANLEKYMMITKGMTYAEVVDIMGGDGESKFKPSRAKTFKHMISYVWRDTAFGQMTVIIYDGVVSGKSQTGLK
jgi:hypothetical protein